MKKIDYSKKYGIPQDRIESIMSMSKKPDRRLSNEKEEIIPKIFVRNRKAHKIKLSKVIKKISEKPNPWNKDNLKKSPWIYKK